MMLAVTKKMMDDLRSASFITEEPAGSIDGVNDAFTFSAEPKAIVVNGSTYRKGRGWTWSAPVATLDFVPQGGADVWGVM